jgi:hypothetical protein
LASHELTIVATYDEAQEALKRQNLPTYDVVLTDLIVPPSSRAASDARGWGYQVEDPTLYGAMIALLALEAGVRHVAVVTDTNHHAHPASAAFDVFRGRPFDVGGTRILCTNDHTVVDTVDEATLEEIDRVFLDSDEGNRKYPYDPEARERKGLVGAKAWDRVLEILLRQ